MSTRTIAAHTASFTGRAVNTLLNDVLNSLTSLVNQRDNITDTVSLLTKNNKAEGNWVSEVDTYLGRISASAAPVVATLQDGRHTNWPCRACTTAADAICDMTLHGIDWQLSHPDSSFKDEDGYTKSASFPLLHRQKGSYGHDTLDVLSDAWNSFAGLVHPEQTVYNLDESNVGVALLVAQQLLIPEDLGDYTRAVMHSEFDGNRASTSLSQALRHAYSSRAKLGDVATLLNAHDSIAEKGPVTSWSPDSPALLQPKVDAWAAANADRMKHLLTRIKSGDDEMSTAP